MFAWLTGRSAPQSTAEELYGRVVAEARQPWFYAGLGVPDTPEGRYELVALHLFLLLERLRSEAQAGEKLSQMLLETFVTDMDDCMREMGVGDLTVPKRVKRAAAGFYERAGIYRAALAEPGLEPLAKALTRFVFNAPDAAGDLTAAEALAAHARNIANTLAQLPANELLGGRFKLTPASPADIRGVT